MRTQNSIQTLTPEQQQRCYFAVVASGLTQADGTRQDNRHAMVRLRNGQMVYVRDLPPISKDNPQPNGDYSVSVVNDHADTVESQSGVGWLFLDSAGLLHMMYCLSTNQAAQAVQPLADDGMLQFSTEGFVREIDSTGTYGDYWIQTVSPVKTGNDPGTQSVENQIGVATMAEATAMTPDQIKTLVQNEVKKNADKQPADIMKAMADLFEQLGITDSKWIADMTADALSAAAGMPYSGDTGKDAAKGEGTDTDPEPAPGNQTEPAGMANGVKEKNAVKTGTAGAFRPEVSQVATNAVVKSDDFDKRKNSPEYLEAWGKAVLNGLHRPNLNDRAAALQPLEGYFKRNDITFDPDSVNLTPEYVITHITELLQSSNNLLSHITQNNGINQYTVPAFVTKTSYAKGRAKGSTKEKKSQTATIQPRTIIAQSLFKFVSLPADFVDNAGGLSGAAVVDWVNRELPAKVIRAAEEALIVGGVKNDDDPATAYTAVHSIVDDIAAPNSPYGEVYTPAAGESLLKSLSTQVANVELLDNAVDLTGIYVILSRSQYRKLLNEAVIGTGEFPANLATTPDAIASFLGVDGVIQVPWLRPSSREQDHNPNIDTFMATYQAAVVNLSAVTGVGEMSPQALSQYYIRANTYDFESKLRFGAALAAPHAGVLIKQPQAGGAPQSLAAMPEQVEE